MIEFFSKNRVFIFCGNLQFFPRKISAAILDNSDFKILIRNIQRFIAFDLIFYLVCISECFVNTKPCKLDAEKIFETIFAILGN